MNQVTNYDVGEEALDRVAIAIGGKTMVNGYEEFAE